MRTLPAAVSTNIAKPITVPTWLVKLGYSTPILLTSGRILTFENMTFARQGLRVQNMTETSLRFILRDDDDAIKAAIDLEGIDDIPVAAWLYYETDGVAVWTGFTDGVRFKKHEADFNASRVRQGSATFPERFFNRTDFPYLPNDGKVISFNGIEITLRSR